MIFHEERFEALYLYLLVELFDLSDQWNPVPDLDLEVDLEVDPGLDPGYLCSRLYLLVTFFIYFIYYIERKKNLAITLKMYKIIKSYFSCYVFCLIGITFFIL
jgi:hypothetical protein